ncbi:MAG TPA: energy transducer TonB, partial [Terriglobales bacterium]|nr:energy transducer TonB [Terriglobales bacterium]
VFLSNVADLFRSVPEPAGVPAAPFWPDVFVATGLPWRSLLQSGLTHGLAVAAIWGLSHVWLGRPQIIARPVFDHSQIVYYSVSEYLPAMKSPAPGARISHPAEPTNAPQEIISVPQEADNRRQTIVTPPNVKLAAEMPLPNLVAWTPLPSAVPVPGSLDSKLRLPDISLPAIPPPPDMPKAITRRADMLPQPQAIAPPPSLAEARNRAAPTVSQPTAIAPTPETTFQMRSQRTHNAPPPAVIAPAPVASTLVHQPGALNVAELQPQVSAPKLPLPPQQVGSNAAPGGMAGHGKGSNATAGNQTASVPDAGGLALARPVGQMIALGLAPTAIHGPIDVPQGNRSGVFAAGPAGHAAAFGVPAGNSGGTAEAGTGNENTSRDKLAGITISREGPAPRNTGSPIVAAVRPRQNLMALASAPVGLHHLPPRVPSDIPGPAPSEVEREVFGAKKFYSVTLNMPNLNSRSGSWVIRFAELKEDPSRGELTAPVVVEKVDPAYPGILMREHITGTVTLYAVIGADGSVADVRVLRGVDDRLDAAARNALQHCHFRPATKNGTAVALEAVIRIPFEVHRIAY